MVGNEKSRTTAATVGRDGRAGTFGGVHAHYHSNTSAQPRQGFSGDIFRTIREAVSAEDAATRYGVAVRNHKALCPFHHDRHPSMSFKNGRWRCWTCNMGGDCIDLVARLDGIKPLEAAQKINADFGLGLSIGGRITGGEREAIRRREALRDRHEVFEAWRETTRQELAQVHRIGWTALGRDDPDSLTAQEIRCITAMETATYYQDVLANDAPPEAQVKLWAERRRLADWIKRILSA